MQYVQVQSGKDVPETGRGSFEYDLWLLVHKELEKTIEAGIGDPAAKQYVGMLCRAQLVYSD